MRLVRLTGVIVLLMSLAGCSSHQAPDAPQHFSYTAGQSGIPSVAEVLNAKGDPWADAALRQPGGPSYEFFANLIPPLRYVDAWFRDYPLVLSAPGAPVKGRLISNGGMINALSRTPAWVTETGTPARIYLGDRRVPFGSDPAHLDGPHCERGYLPIYTLHDTVDGSRYSQRIFAATDPALSGNGVIYVQFTLENGDAGRVELQFERTGQLKQDHGAFRDADGKVCYCVGPGWNFRWAVGGVFAQLKKGESVTIAIATHPARAPFPADAGAFDKAHEQAVATWQQLLDHSTQIEVPEPLVNDAWRALVCGSYGLLDGDRLCYSAGNQYSHLYEAEGGDAVRSLLLWGRRDDVRPMIVELLKFSRKGLEFHQAGLKLQLIASYYWLTRDAQFVREQAPLWRPEVQRIIDGREKSSGLLPREQYAGDIPTPVYSLNVDANSWAGLHHIAAVLDDLGEHDEAKSINTVAVEFRKVILDAVDKSTYRDVQPPFIPMALFGEEKPPERITAARPWSYWTLIAPYVLGSGVFAYESPQATNIIEYFQRHMGLCMGMVRSRPAPGFWIDTANIDDLYGIRYDLALFQRDDVDRTLVAFYAKLAQGMTRDTFICAEGTAIMPLDERGRQMYMPPNSAGNAHFLYLLRYALIQDWDMDGDGKPDTLRLLFATPRRWLEDGKEIKVGHAPTAFGEVSVATHSHLKQGTVDVEVELPKITPMKSLLRLRLPDGYHVKAIADHPELKPASDDSLDLSTLRGKVRLSVQVAR